MHLSLIIIHERVEVVRGWGGDPLGFVDRGRREPKSKFVLMNEPESKLHIPS
ncbi:hypothetical protein HanRHA438_Chr12g0563251 [Helianthus annuus]|nr:hypothetical protein HanRHA438_Chr12g0563251 [Helianthus annuus]